MLLLQIIKKKKKKKKKKTLNFSKVNIEDALIWYYYDILELTQRKTLDQIPAPNIRYQSNTCFCLERLKSQLMLCLIWKLWAWGIHCSWIRLTLNEHIFQLKGKIVLQVSSYISYISNSCKYWAHTRNISNFNFQFPPQNFCCWA